MILPNKCIVDTNVPKTANLANDPSDIPDELVACVANCVRKLLNMSLKNAAIIDAGDEIFDEYRKQLDMKGRLVWVTIS